MIMTMEIVKNSQKGIDNIQVNFPIKTVKVLLQILIAVFKYKSKFLIAVKYIVQPYNIFMFQLLEQTDFS